MPAVAAAAAAEDDHFSFDDSDRFEEDSICTWSSEPESMCNNWRGWKKPNATTTATTTATNGSSFMGIPLGPVTSMGAVSASVVGGSFMERMATEKNRKSDSEGDYYD